MRQLANHSTFNNEKDTNLIECYYKRPRQEKYETIHLRKLKRLWNPPFFWTINAFEWEHIVGTPLYSGLGTPSF